MLSKDNLECIVQYCLVLFTWWRIVWYYLRGGELSGIIYVVANCLVLYTWWRIVWYYLRGGELSGVIIRGDMSLVKYIAAINHC